MNFHLSLHSVKRQPKTKSALIIGITLLTIFLFSPSNSFAQQLQIRHETAYGSLDFDLGEHNVLINSKGEVVTFGIRRCSPCTNSDFLVTIFNQQLRQLSQWSLPFNAAGHAADIIETADGGYVIIGTRNEIVDTIAQMENADIQIIKISGTGVLQWEKKYGGTGQEEAVGIQQTADGGYLIISNTMSNDLVIQNPTGSPQVWLAKLDASGNALWGKLLTNQYYNNATDFTKTKDGNFVLCGSTRDTAAFGTNVSRQDALLMKFNEQGTVLWQQHIGGNADDEGFEKISVDRNGAIFVAGYTRSTNLQAQQNRGGSDGWIVKLSEAGDILSSKLIGGSSDDWLTAIAVSSTGEVTAGGITVSSDGDLLDNVHMYTIWATNYQDGSNDLRHGFFGHSKDNSSAINDIAIDVNSNIFCVAQSGPGNIMMRNPIGGPDGWVFALGEPNLVKASAYVDVNNNGTRDANEKFFNGGKLEIIKNSDPTRPAYFSTSKTAFVANIDTGAHTVRFLPHQPFYTVVPTERTVDFPTFGMIDSFTVRLIPIGVKPDLAVNITPLNIPRPGFEASYIISVINRGNTIADNIVIKLVKDPRLSILNAAPAISASTNDTLEWNVESLSILDSIHIQVNVRIAAPPATAIGDKLVSQVSVLYQQVDETPLNNSFELSELVAGSYDPNDKTELHGGLFAANLLTTDNFRYLVRFQNTGTDTAFNILIRDTLHGSLDISGIEMLAASHPYTMTVKNGNQLEWKFSNVLLPDSNVNEKASHGFVAFSVKPKSSLVVGDVITNRASIYFDYNLPIQTNTTSTRIADVSVVLPKPVITGLQNSYCGNDKIQAIKISNLAAAGQATITVKLDGSALSIDNNANISFDPTKLQSGTHNIEVSFSANGTRSTFNASFTINAPVKPVVKLNANVAVVNNTTTAILFSAVAISGGGNSPLYTFSTDRNMSGILQTEGSSNTLIASSQILSEGDNWIYLRMKTSEQCVTSTIAVDSIKIVRNAVTGIVDVDFPRSIITAYPNPFSSDVTIQGLQASGHYMIQLINAGGNIVRTQDVQRKTSITFYNLNINSGIYFIRLYDKKKNRWVGSMPVIGL